MAQRMLQTGKQISDALEKKPAMNLNTLRLIHALITALTLCDERASFQLVLPLLQCYPDELTEIYLRF